MSATLSSISKYRARLSGQVGRRATTVNVSSLRETAVLGSGKGIRRSLHDSTSTSNLPQVLDLLERYRGLVALGQINYDEEQVRVVMQVRFFHISRHILGTYTVDVTSFEDCRRNSQITHLPLSCYDSLGREQAKRRNRPMTRPGGLTLVVKSRFQKVKLLFV